MFYRLAISTILLIQTLVAGAITDLSSELNAYIGRSNADIGVAVITDCGDTITVNDHRRYQMNSVMKLYQAMAVMNALERGGMPIDSVVTIHPSELHSDTWSPMRDQYNSENEILIPISRLIEYSIQQSDNNACDILFDHVAGTNDTDRYIRTLGIEGFAITVNENAMHQDPTLSDANWTYPSAAASLIHKLFTQQLYAPEYQDFLISTLTGCKTGNMRLPSPLPGDAIIGHKTGTGFNDLEGNPQGINDVGCIRLSNGRTYAIAVFIGHTDTDMSGSEQIIADISSIVLNHIQH